MARLLRYAIHALLLVLFIWFASVSGSAGLLLFVLCPLAYLTLPVRHAQVFVVLYSLTPTLTGLVQGETRLALTVYLPLGLGSMAVAILAGELFARTRQLATIQERQRWSADIHDTVAQGLSSVVMLLEAAMAAPPDVARKHMGLAIDTARDSLHETRALVGALAPAPLPDAIRRLATRSGASLQMQGVARPLPTAMDVVLLRVAQEALANAARHACASRVEVRLEFSGNLVALEVRDDGVGFSPSSVESGYGLDGMRERVAQAGGRLTVHSGQTGTVVRAEVPA